jgi:hypothetical protein
MEWQSFHTRLDQMVSFIQMMKVEIDEQLEKYRQENRWSLF